MSTGKKSTKVKVDNVLDVVVSAAAVPILLGALFKITHAPGADIWIKAGLYTEAGVFLLYAIKSWLYPETHDYESEHIVAAQPIVQQPSVKVEFSDLGLSGEQIGKLKADFLSLGSSIEQFGQNLGDIKEVSQTLLSGTANAKKTQDELAAMADNLGKLNQVYGNMLNAMSGGGAR